jgi:hypothetical protein
VIGIIAGAWRLAAEAAAGSRLRVKCVRCGRMFDRSVTAAGFAAEISPVSAHQVPR